MKAFQSDLLSGCAGLIKYKSLQCFRIGRTPKHDCLFVYCGHNDRAAKMFKYELFDRVEKLTQLFPGKNASLVLVL